MASQSPNYPPHIKQAIDQLNRQRKLLAGAFIGILLLILACIVVVFNVDDSFKVVVPLGVTLVPGAILVYRLRSSNYILKAKKQLIEPLIKWMNPALSYDAQKGIGPKTFAASGLVKEPFNHYECEDLVKGTINGIGFLLSDAVVGRVETYRQRDDNHENVTEHYIHVFEGILFVARDPDTMNSFVSRDAWEAELQKRSKALDGGDLFG